jgi:hypothetical protein
MSVRARSILICRNGPSPQRRYLTGSKNRIKPIWLEPAGSRPPQSTAPAGRWRCINAVPVIFNHGVEGSSPFALSKEIKAFLEFSLASRRHLGSAWQTRACDTIARLAGSVAHSGSLASRAHRLVSAAYRRCAKSSELRARIRQAAEGIVSTVPACRGAPSPRAIDLLEELEPDIKEGGAASKRSHRFLSAMVKPGPHGRQNNPRWLITGCQAFPDSRKAAGLSCFTAPHVPAARRQRRGCHRGVAAAVLMRGQPTLVKFAMSAGFS